MGKLFLLDANVLIRAHRQYYAFDIVPSFWDKINDAKVINSWAIIDKVHDEITVSKDPLCDWIRANYCGRVISSNEPNVIQEYSKMISSLMSDPYPESARREFGSVADSWMIAHAVASNHSIVTEEKSQNSLKRIKIPDMCNKHGVEYINTFDFLRRVGIKL